LTVRLSPYPVAAGLYWLAVAVAPVSAEPLGPWAGPQIAMAGASEAWHAELPLRFTERIDGYHLVGSNLYAIGDDGSVRAVRATDGLHLWTVPLAGKFETIWPPTAAVLDGKPAAVFTLIKEVVFLDPASGYELERLKLRTTTTAGVAMDHESLFQVGLDGRVFCLRKKDGVKTWSFGTPATIDQPVIYRPDGDEIIAVDTQGMVVCFSGDGTKKFVRTLEADPAGPVVADRLAIYVATTNGVVTAFARGSGDLLWRYRMVERPAGGPFVTHTALYQATAEGGLYRFDLGGTPVLATRPAPPPSVADAASIGRAVPDYVPSTQPGSYIPEASTAVRDRPMIDADREIRRWYLPTGKQFLADWPERVVVLLTNGQVGLVPRNSTTGEPSELLDLGRVDVAVSNRLNDAVIVATRKGQIRCVRPIDAPALTPADFGVVTTQPAAEQPPAETGGEAAPPQGEQPGVTSAQ